MLKVPWDRANQPIPLKLQLLDSDGHPVLLTTPDGPRPVGGEMTMEVGRPAGVAAGSLLDSAFVLSIPSLPLPVGRYEWRLEVAGTQITSSFQVRQT